MLVITRIENEIIKVGDKMKITSVRIGLGQVKVGIDALENVHFMRGN
jgi:carbon storage regulator CsrA